jgi:hypothetical protein
MCSPEEIACAVACQLESILEMHETLLAQDLTGRSVVAPMRVARLTLEREGRLSILHVIVATCRQSLSRHTGAHAILPERRGAAPTWSR